MQKGRYIGNQEEIAARILGVKVRYTVNCVINNYDVSNPTEPDKVTDFYMVKDKIIVMKWNSILNTRTESIM